MVTRRIYSIEELPADGCITIRTNMGYLPSTRRKGWRIERVLRDGKATGTPAWFLASPMTISTGKTTGEPVELCIAFPFDIVETMEGSD